MTIPHGEWGRGGGLHGRLRGLLTAGLDPQTHPPGPKCAVLSCVRLLADPIQLLTHAGLEAFQLKVLGQMGA